MKDDIRKCLDNELFYAAYMDSLCLPDICGFIDDPKLASKRRYMKWFEENASKYMPLLTPEEAYAMRCVVLHNGSPSTEMYHVGSPQSSILLDKYVLTINNSSHMIRFNNCSVNGIPLGNMIVFNIPNYCEDILQAVTDWEKKKGKKLEDYEQILRFHNGPLDLGIALIS